MKNRNIFLAHNKYHYKGGEDVVFEQESELLKSNAYSVFEYVLDNSKELKSLREKAKLIFNTHYSDDSYRKINLKLTEADPEIVHVHNFFPLITPAIFYVAKENDLPTVLTLHNYRLFHPNGLLLNDGEIDERGIKSSAYSCIKDKVYRDSYLQTAVVAHMIEYHKKRNTWNRKIDCFIALSDFAKSKFVEGGIDEGKITVKPNFVYDPSDTMDIQLIHNKQPCFIYVGRISVEKDVETILRGWKNLPYNAILKVVGTGPLKERLQKETASQENIKWLGQIPREEVFKQLSTATALIFSSRCYENFPMTILEAFSVATPVVSSDIGSQAEIVKNKYTGLQFKTGDAEDLAIKVRKLIDDGDLVGNLSINARQEYEENYTPERNMELLNEIYDELI